MKEKKWVSLSDHPSVSDTINEMKTSIHRLALLTCNTVDDAEGHHDEGHQEVGDGQRQQEVVGDVLEPSLEGDGHDCQDVAADAKQAHRGEQQEHPVAHRLFEGGQPRRVVVA